MTEETKHDHAKETDGDISQEDELKPLLVGSSIFEDFITEEAPLVDKTRLIFNLIKRYERPYFLARPRRFGKTFLLDTLHDIFMGKWNNFANLAIGKLFPKEKWESFPIIRIDMSSFGAEEYGNGVGFSTVLISYLAGLAADFGIELDTTSIGNAVTSFISRLSRAHGKFGFLKGNDKDVVNPKNVVLLIDEYDDPLLSNINDQAKSQEIRLVLRRFYSAIKANIKKLRFVFITGITRFRQLSLFSSLNTIKDISFEQDFSTICGFTEDEISNVYAEHLEAALATLKTRGEFEQNSTVEDLMQKIKNWYDGYSWDGTRRVFNPDSIKMFLESAGFSYYWYLSGTPLLTYLLMNKSSEPFKIFDKDLEITTPLGLEDTIDINSTSFLLYSGYLTVSDASGNLPKKTYRLEIPNNEIKYAIERELTTKYFVPSGEADPPSYLAGKKNSLLAAFCSLNEVEAERRLSSEFSTYDRKLYEGGGENIFHLLIGALLKYGDDLPQSNHPSAGGMPDLVFPVPGGDDRIVIEIKYHKAVPRPGEADSNIRQPSTSERARILEDVGVKDAGSQPPAVVSDRKMSVLKETERVGHILSGLIDKAFAQIAGQCYHLPYMEKEGKVYAAAVGVYDIATVRVRFAEMVWENTESGVPSINELHPSAG
ncbi:MAG: AAA family ATPase [Deltaproteobacteria bacterium]|jgi:hypothetical protein|nr:AAA family ATPase [Deltaproteobacteria bacterium]